MVDRTVGDQRSRDERHFDRWARRYDRSLAQPLLFGPVQHSVVAAIATRLPTSAAVLDLGCGTGRLLDQMRAARPDAMLIGLDRSDGMVRAAHRLRPHLHIARGAAEALPYADHSFDAVTTTVSFHHWSDKAAALAQVRRVLRPGGLFALTDVSVDDLPDHPRRLWALARRSMDDMPSLAERHRLLHAAGLRVLEIGPTLHHRWVTLTLSERAAA